MVDYKELKDFVEKKEAATKAWIFGVMDKEGNVQVSVGGNMMELCFIEKSIGHATDSVMMAPTKVSSLR